MAKLTDEQSERLDAVLSGKPPYRRPLTLSEQLRAQERQHMVEILDSRIRYYDERGSILATALSRELRYVRNLVLASTPLPPSGGVLV